MDNNGTTDADFSEVTGVIDSADSGNCVKLGEFTNGQGAAAVGATVSLWRGYMTSTLAIGCTIIASFPFSPNDVAMQTWEFTVGAGGILLH